MVGFKFLDETASISNEVDEKLVHDLFKDKTCAVVGSSGALLKRSDGNLIDSHDIVIRCNNAPTLGYEDHVGSKTDGRVVNCHMCWALESSDQSYLKHLSDRMPAFDPKFLYSLRNEFIIPKDQIHPGNFQKQQDLLEKNGCKVMYMNPVFYGASSSLLGDLATNGFAAIMFAAKHFKHVSCFGFTFGREWGKDWNNFHYYQEIKMMGEAESCHNGSKEEEIVLRFDQNRPNFFLQRY